jgi:hypothetical protein
MQAFMILLAKEKKTAVIFLTQDSTTARCNAEKLQISVILTMETMKNTILCDVMQCCPVGVRRCFGGKRRFHVHGQRSSLKQAGG